MDEDRIHKRNFSLAIALVLVAAMFSFYLQPITTGKYTYLERAILTPDLEPGETSFSQTKVVQKSFKEFIDLPITTFVITPETPLLEIPGQTELVQVRLDHEKFENYLPVIAFTQEQYRKWVVEGGSVEVDLIKDSVLAVYRGSDGSIKTLDMSLLHWLMMPEQSLCEQEMVRMGVKINNEIVGISLFGWHDIFRPSVHTCLPLIGTSPAGVGAATCIFISPDVCSSYSYNAEWEVTHTRKGKCAWIQSGSILGTPAYLCFCDW